MSHIVRYHKLLNKSIMMLITIRIHDISPKNSKVRYSVWCDSEEKDPKFMETDLTKNEALEVAQKHDSLHTNHLLRIEEV